MQNSTCGPRIVFLGPSLPRAAALELLPDADLRPPAKRGDIGRAIGEQPAFLALIDGVFHAQPSVWPREIVAALDHGIQVLGASSMGALRAVECEPFGMQGRGVIFDWFKGGIIDGDDEVAVRHAGAEDGYRCHSEPLVNIRATIARAVVQGLLAAEEAHELLLEAKATFYPDRSLLALASGAAARSLGEERRRVLRAWLVANRVDQKRADAAALLAELAVSARRAAGPLSPSREERQSL